MEPIERSRRQKARNGHASPLHQHAIQPSFPQHRQEPARLEARGRGERERYDFDVAARRARAARIGVGTNPEGRGGAVA